jgi:hypothetical protein
MIFASAATSWKRRWNGWLSLTAALSGRVGAGRHWMICSGRLIVLTMRLRRCGRQIGSQNGQKGRHNGQQNERQPSTLGQQMFAQVALRRPQCAPFAAGVLPRTVTDAPTAEHPLARAEQGWCGVGQLLPNGALSVVRLAKQLLDGEKRVEDGHLQHDRAVLLPVTTHDARPG